MNPTVAWLTFAFLQVLMWAIVARALMTWLPVDQNNPLVQMLHTITEPILDPLRKVVPRIGMIDITPMAAIILLVILSRLVQSAAAS